MNSPLSPNDRAANKAAETYADELEDGEAGLRAGAWIAVSLMLFGLIGAVVFAVVTS